MEETVPTLKNGKVKGSILEDKNYELMQTDPSISQPDLSQRNTSSQNMTSSQRNTSNNTSSQRNMKPEISQMHKDIMSLQEKIRQLET